MTDLYALALDIGGSHVTAAVVDLEARRVVENSLSRRGTKIDDPEVTLIEAWAGAALDALEKAGVGTVARVGAGMPGPFDYGQGISWHTQKFTSLYGQSVYQAMQNRWQNTPLEGVKLRFANDAALWALGEWWLGDMQGMKRVIGVTLGTGLGSGFINEGRIISAGESVPPGGEIWNTPYLDDIAENYAAAASLTRFYRKLTGVELTPAEIAARAANGEAAACQIYHEFGAHLGAIFAPWIECFRPDCLVMGGNIAHAWPYFREALSASLPGLDCRVTEFFEASSLLGAAALS